MKQHSIPTSDEVRAAMDGLSRTALKRLSALCGVSVHTLIKIRDGATADPGVDTVGRMWPHLPIVRTVFIDPAVEVAPLPVAAPKTRPPRGGVASATSPPF